MKISYNWLKDFVKLPDSISAEEVAEKLKLSTVEVEDVITQSELLDKVVVGKVLSVEKHPDADKLKVCSVDVGDEKLTLVCGGSNVREGMLVAVAKLGAKVKWHGEGEPVVLEKAKIRGVESSGMICGADEIGLAEIFPKKEEKEIVDLTELKLKVGKPVAEALHLGDKIFEIDNKSLSNRPDLWGHYGLAREVAVLTGRNVSEYKIKPLNTKSSGTIRVTIEDKKACPRYMAVAVAGVKVGESPLLVKQRLLAAGIRPINNVVDITNYVMLELGQPMHAFDGNKIKTAERYEIVVKPAKTGDKFTTLDGKERSLPGEAVLIATPEKVLAIGGVMGGLESGITESTTEVVFEAANFNASFIRKTSVALGLRTDASSRFEKGLDIGLAEVAIQKAVQMLLEFCPKATVTTRIADAGEARAQTRPLEFNFDFFAKSIGEEIPVKTITKILERLGFTVKTKGKIFSTVVPSWRANDVSLPEAVVEEVVRIYGYENIHSSLPSFAIDPPIKNELRALERKTTDLLVKEFAFNEIYNYSFVSGESIKKIGDEKNAYLELDNPLSKEKPYLRRNLLPNLMEVLSVNSTGRDTLDIFEIGQVFLKDQPGQRVSETGNELLPREDTHLLVLCYAKDGDKGFKLARQVVEGLEKRLYYSITIAKSENINPYQHGGRSADLKVGELVVGNVFELHPRVVKSFGLEGRVGAVFVNLSLLSEKISERNVSHYEPLPLFPQIERDLAFVIDKARSHGEVQDILNGVDPLLKKVTLFDVFESEAVGKGKKSMAYHLTYGSTERTLTTEEAVKAEEKIKASLVEKLHVEFR